MENKNEEVIVVNDSIDLHGAPHTVCEAIRETFSTIPEKSDEELYAVPKKEDKEESVKEEPVEN